MDDVNFALASAEGARASIEALLDDQSGCWRAGERLRAEVFLERRPVLRGGPAADPREAARLRGEAMALARIGHPNIIQIYEVGETGGRPFLALEFAPGGSLEARLRGGPQPARAAAALLETLARAVHA